MKRIILSCIVALSLFSADAQTKKGKKSGKKPTKEAIAKSNFNKKEAAKKQAREAQLLAMVSADSLRLQSDSIADALTKNDRLVYKAQGLKAIDSMNKVTYVNLNKQRGEWEKTERNNAEIMRAAKLSDYESKQVKFINQTYNEKANALIKNSSTEQKKQELILLNEERKAKIKTIIGKSKERKLDKERKEYVTKHGSDQDSQWVDAAENFAKK